MTEAISQSQAQPRASKSLQIPIIAIAAVSVSLFAWLWVSGNAMKANAPVPILGQAPQFSLIERNGRTITNDDLLGSVWIADFIFTRCAGPCPELALRMRSLQQSLESRQGKVKLVSISLDPDFDTPRVLTKYASRHQADANRWLFLTGPDQKEIHTLVQSGFLQTVIPAEGGNPIIHSTYFVLVDTLGRIRGFYDGLDPGTKLQLLDAVDAILAEPPGA